MAINREKLYKRCQGLCEKCGISLPDSFAAHHRKLRSQGGKDTLDNAVALHHECHNLGTKSVHLNPKVSYENGFMVHSWDNPQEVPVLIPFLGLTILTKEGKYENHSSNEESR
jgi:hypothetical protein